MHTPAEIKKHAVLMDRMAQARGLDMQEQVSLGHISSDQLADAVLNCADCSNAAGCRQWLDSRTAVAPATPDYCRNAVLFDVLKQL